MLLTSAAEAGYFSDPIGTTEVVPSRFRCRSEFQARATFRIKVKGDGQECPSHTVPFWEWCWVGRWIFVDFDFGGWG